MKNENELPLKNQRIKQIIDEQYKGKILQFCRACGIEAHQKVYRLFKIDDRLGYIPEVSDELLSIISRKLNIPYDQLSTTEPKSIIVTSGKTIKYWQDIDATCGGTEIFTDCDSAKIINLQIPDFKDCTDAINIYGDSMYPQYKNGQIILLKKWEESYIEYGCAYLIVTTGGHRMVKQLRKAPDESNVICYSVNQEFEQFEIPKKDILSLWLVKGSIDKSNI